MLLLLHGCRTGSGGAWGRLVGSRCLRVLVATQQWLLQRCYIFTGSLLLLAERRSVLQCMPCIQGCHCC